MDMRACGVLNRGVVGLRFLTVGIVELLFNTPNKSLTYGIQHKSYNQE